MTTVDDVIDRVLRDFLLPPGEQPTRFEVGAGGIDNSSVTLPVDASLLSAEEQDLIGPGTLIEVGTELMLVEAVAGDPPTSLTVRRGMYGTAAAAHTADDFVFLAPEFPRQQMFEAVSDSIEALWPDLWTVAVDEVWTLDGPVELSSTVGEVLDVRVQSGSRWERIAGWDDIYDFPHASTGIVLQTDVRVNRALHVYYKKIPQRPTAVTDTLSDLGVEDGWIKVIAAGTVAQVVSNEDVDRATVEFITQALENEGFQPGQGADLRNSLLQYQDFLMGPLKRSLEMRAPSRSMVSGRF